MIDHMTDNVIFSHDTANLILSMKDPEKGIYQIILDNKMSGRIYNVCSNVIHNILTR